MLNKRLLIFFFICLTRTIYPSQSLSTKEELAIIKTLPIDLQSLIVSFLILYRKTYEQRSSNTTEGDCRHFSEEEAQTADHNEWWTTPMYQRSALLRRPLMKCSPEHPMTPDLEGGSLLFIKLRGEAITPIHHFFIMDNLVIANYRLNQNPSNALSMKK